MKNMKMKTRMIIGFAIPIILTILNALIGMSSINRIKTSIEDMQKEEYTVISEKLQEIGADGEKAKIITDTLQSTIVDDNALIERTANISNIASLVMIVVSVVISLFIAFSLIKAIAQSVRQLSDAAKDIALGRVNHITMTKYANDEFGELVDEYTKVIDNIKYQAEIAEEVSNGKIIKRTVKLKAHDENNECRIGDRVEVMETRPLSKDKRWRVTNIIEKAK